MSISSLGITDNDRPSRTAVLLLLGVLLALFGGVSVWQWWYRAPDAATAMAKGQYARAYHFYLEQARHGDAAAQNAVANLHYLGMGIERDYEAAVDWYFAAASQGHAPAQLNLGHLYQQGMGVSRDPVRAFGWYNMSHKSGNELAEYYLSQVAAEWTLSPLMISTAKERWAKLEFLLQEKL